MVLVRLGAALGCVLALGACTSSQMSTLPTSVGGLPADAPERAAEGKQLAYPAVHDMPPPRPTHLMTPAEAQQAEAEMARIRDGKGKPAPAAKSR